MPAPAALLGPVQVLGAALDVAAVGDRHHHLLGGDHVLDVDLAVDVHDLGAALVAVQLPDLLQLARRSPAVSSVSLARMASSWAISSPTSLISCDQSLALQAGQLGQPHVQDGLGLARRQVEALDQAALGGVGVLRRPDDLDDRVDVVDGDLQALDDVQPLPRLAQVEQRAPGDHLAAVVR